MGVIQPDFWLYDYYVDFFMRRNKKQPEDVAMLELGNQTFQDEVLMEKLNLPRTVKEYWEKRGIRHTSVDLNAEDGAIPLNLSVPLPREYFNQFDIVTNGGTSEHVDNQFECWKNIHKCLKLNGFLLSANPEKYNYNDKHCDWFYDTDFFEVFAKRLGYTVHMNGRVLFPFNGGYVIFAALEKVEELEFDFTKEELDSLLLKIR